MTKRDLTSQTAPDTPDIQAEAKARGLPEYVVRANRAVPNQLLRDLVSDAYRPVSHSGSMIPDRQRAEPVTKGSNGWQEPAPLNGVDTRWCDLQMDAQDQKDRNARLREASENAWIESRLEKSEPRVQSDFNPFSAENMKK